MHSFVLLINQAELPVLFAYRLLADDKMIKTTETMYHTSLDTTPNMEKY